MIPVCLGWADNGWRGAFSGNSEVADYADLARLTHVTRSRITQIMRLLLLTPDIQEALLLQPLSNVGRAAIHERIIRPIAAILDWRMQRMMWQEIKTEPSASPWQNGMTLDLRIRLNAIGRGAF